MLTTRTLGKCLGAIKCPARTSPLHWRRIILAPSSGKCAMLLFADPRTSTALDSAATARAEISAMRVAECAVVHLAASLTNMVSATTPALLLSVTALDWANTYCFSLRSGCSVSLTITRKWRMENIEGSCTRTSTPTRWLLDHLGLLAVQFRLNALPPVSPVAFPFSIETTPFTRTYSSPAG